MSPVLSRHQFELTLAAVAATVATHLGHLPPWLALAFALVLALRAVERRRGRSKTVAWLRLPLAGLLVVLVVQQYGNLFGREPGSVLACGVLTLKLLESERQRDARVVLGFAAFVLMSALLFTQTLWFTLGVAAIVALLLAALASLQPAPLPGRRLRRELALGATLLAAGLPLAAASFLLVPRLGNPLWGAPGQDMEARTGLSERMTPGDFVELLIDDSPAFRVSVAGDVPPPSSQLYFRALVMWDFDGASWTRGGGDFMPPAAVEPLGEPLAYTLTLEPSGRHWLPALDVPLASPPGTRIGRDRAVLMRQPAEQPRRFELSSSTRYRFEPQLPDAARARALALPEGFDPRTRELAARWRVLHGDDDEAIVREALANFNARFHYTLTPPLLGRHAVDDFLFETQQGYCEHYSGAFVVLMRAAGIPARVVTGYQGGWWNARGNYLLVRQSDAHAWAEIWRPGIGWQRVDPTAAVDPVRIDPGSPGGPARDGRQLDWLQNLRNQLDLANRVWTEGVVRFDALRQKGLLTPFGIASAEPGDLMKVLSILLAGLLVVGTLWAVRQPRSGGDALDRAWQTLQDRLRRAGLPPRASEGPLDLLARARRTRPELAPALRPLVSRYAYLRYAVAEPDPAAVRALRQAIHRSRFARRRGAAPWRAAP